MRPAAETVRLIVNADDYGYFQCVSRGILEGARAGVISATGIMANSPRYDEHMQWLQEVAELDVGVHLNLTHGQPLGPEMGAALQERGGTFADKFTLVRQVLSGKLPLASIRAEWRAQIERCKGSGIELQFLNSHEHIHMLPPLFRLARQLAHEYRIPHVRYSTPELKGRLGAAGMVRNSALFALNLFNRRPVPPIRLLGMNESGKLSGAYLESVLPSLEPGSCYELMCHPGHFDRQEIDAPELLAYHHWEHELVLLTGDHFRHLCETHNIEISGYRALEGPQGQAV